VTLLAIETATDRASVAVNDVEREIVGARRHAAELLPAIAALLGDAGIGLGDVTGLVLSDGPGSFTGLRVGAAVAKALVHVCGLPLWTAPSLLVRAAGVARPGETVMAVANALRGEVYAAVYRFDDTAIRELLPPSVYQPEDLVARALRLDHLVGEAPAPVVRLLEQGMGRGLIGPPMGAPRARTLLDLVDRPGAAVRIAAVGGWEPVYGRPAEAQARWEMAHGRPLPDSVGSPG
jgi:tRNA threonylcarbamoyladenosine biosynthesis protein TsaB